MVALNPRLLSTRKMQVPFVGELRDASVLNILLSEPTSSVNALKKRRTMSDCDTESQIVDILTNGLSTTRHQKLRDLLGVRFIDI